MSDLILHIGHAKTGTTSLQTALKSHKPQLAEAGILYPDSGARIKHGGHFKWFKPGATRTETRQSARLWAALDKQLKTAPPELTVLSYETLFAGPYSDVTQEIEAFLKRRFARIQVVVYLREPVSYALSLLQQSLKSGATLGWPAPDFYRRNLENWQRVSGGQVAAHHFDKSKLSGGNLVADFRARYLPGAPEIAATASRENTSISPEAMQLLQSYWSSEIDIPGLARVGGSNPIKSLVMRVDRDLEGFRRPVLRLEVIEMVAARQRDLAWLDREYGIDFGLVSQGRGDHDALSALRNVDEIVAVDPDRYDALLAAVSDAAQAEAGPIWKVPIRMLSRRR